MGKLTEEQQEFVYRDGVYAFEFEDLNMGFLETTLTSDGHLKIIKAHCFSRALSIVEIDFMKLMCKHNINVITYKKRDEDLESVTIYRIRNGWHKC